VRSLCKATGVVAAVAAAVLTFVPVAAANPSRVLMSDACSPSFNDAKPHGYTPKGGTGAAVRTLVQLAEDIAAGAL